MCTKEVTCCSETTWKILEISNMREEKQENYFHCLKWDLWNRLCCTPLLMAIWIYTFEPTKWFQQLFQSWLNHTFISWENQTFYRKVYISPTENAWLNDCNFLLFHNIRIATGYWFNGEKFKKLDFDLRSCRTFNLCCQTLLCDRYPWCLEEKAGSLQCQFKTMAVCCFAVSLSACLCERGRAAGSDEATHTLLERNDHLSPSDSQGLGYQSKGRESSKGGGGEQEEMFQKLYEHAQVSISV